MSASCVPVTLSSLSQEKLQWHSFTIESDQQLGSYEDYEIKVESLNKTNIDYGH